MMRRLLVLATLLAVSSLAIPATGMAQDENGGGSDESAQSSPTGSGSGDGAPPAACPAGKARLANGNCPAVPKPDSTEADPFGSVEWQGSPLDTPEGASGGDPPINVLG